MYSRDNPNVSIVVPAYNEEALIQQNLTLIKEYLEMRNGEFTWELIAVNDGSKDATGSILDEFAADDVRVRVIHHFANTNLGKTLRDAFAAARGQYVITLDADLSYGPEHIGRLFTAITDTQADIVIASPYAPGGKVSSVPRHREFLSRCSNRLLSLVAQGHLSTLTGMVRAYNAQFLRTLNLKSWDFEINTEIIYKAQLLRARIVEIPAHLDWSTQIAVADRRSSSIKIARSVGSQAFTSFLFRPFLYFILPGLVVLILALYSLGWSTFHTVNAWLGTPNNFSEAIAFAFTLSPHSFVVGGIALIAAIQLMSLGILSVQSKRYFEELFHLETQVFREVQSTASSGGISAP